MKRKDIKITLSKDVVAAFENLPPASRWTEEMDEVIRRYYHKSSRRVFAAAFIKQFHCCSRTSIDSRATKIGVIKEAP